MTVIPDDELFKYSDRVKGKVVLITGAANGIGKETALRFGSYGAKVVIGDRDVAGALRTVAEIKANNGEGISTKCDVTVWEDLVSLFELTVATYGAVDIVVANAGVGEIGDFDDVSFVDGRPVKPNMTTLNVNLYGVVYTSHLAQHYLALHKKEGSLKALIMIGSMASWSGIPKAAMYTASKHAVLGLMRSIYPFFQAKGIRIATIHPWFADTAILHVVVKLILAGLPLTPVPRVAGAIFYAATEPSPETSGSAWLLPDDGPVFLVPKENFKLGVYKMIDDRINSLTRGAQGVAYYAILTRDVVRILKKPLLTVGVAAVVARMTWSYRQHLLQYVYA